MEEGLHCLIRQNLCLFYNGLTGFRDRHRSRKDKSTWLSTWSLIHKQNFFSGCKVDESRSNSNLTSFIGRRRQRTTFNIRSNNFLVYHHHLLETPSLPPTSIIAFSIATSTCITDFVSVYFYDSFISSSLDIIAYIRLNSSDNIWFQFLVLDSLSRIRTFDNHCRLSLPRPSRSRPLLQKLKYFYRPT